MMSKIVIAKKNKPNNNKNQYPKEVKFCKKNKMSMNLKLIPRPPFY